MQNSHIENVTVILLDSFEEYSFFFILVWKKHPRRKKNHHLAIINRTGIEKAKIKINWQIEMAHLKMFAQK